MAELIFGTKHIKTENPAFVMGILNATPDSFFKDSRGGLELAKQLIADGADVLDIGGESTRPGFTEVPEDEEISRIVPLITKIREFSDIPISVDTRKSKVFKAAYEAGADVLNDVSSFDDDLQMLETLSKTDAGLILMHRWPEVENHAGDASTILKKVDEELLPKIQCALKSGVSKEKIMVDPGIGFGKSFEENLELIKHCGKMLDGQYPVLMALSRKRCIGQMTDQPVENRLVGTVAADMLSVINGAVMIRVHDVKAASDSLKVMKYLLK